MAWSQKLPSGKYRGCYRAGGPKTRYVPGTFNTAAEAERRGAVMEDEQRTPGAIDPRSAKLPFGRWFEMWMDSHQVATSTEREYRSTARLHILPYWEDVALADITARGGRTWVKRLQKEPREGAAKPRSPWTIRLAVQTFVAAVNAAVEDKRLHVNEVKGLSWPDLPDGLERYLTPTEVEATTRFMTPFNSLLTWTAVTTGLRAGELAGLHIPRIDTRNGGLLVVEQYDQKDGVIKPVPKDKEKRYVPMPDDVLADLRAHVETLPETDDCGVPHLAGTCPGGVLVFRGPKGSPLKSNQFGRYILTPAVQLAKVKGRVRVHDLR
ncbi:MAG TPA: site-specific integrase, partial [Umezawaea sp.]|nr:site-specific integrase [Umezawaea sp.]